MFAYLVDLHTVRGEEQDSTPVTSLSIGILLLVSITEIVLKTISVSILEWNLPLELTRAYRNMEIVLAYLCFGLSSAVHQCGGWVVMVYLARPGEGHGEVSESEKKTQLMIKEVEM